MYILVNCGYLPLPLSMDIKAKPKDRQPSSNISGSPKKGGGGGKYSWGKGGLDDLKAVSIKDEKDPNYDSEEETNEEVVIAKTEITSPIEVLIQDFLASGDVEETIKALKELKIENTSEQFVKKSIIRAMEKQAYERELVSKLLSSVYNVAVTPEKISDGFQAALNSLEDIVLDNPDAVDMLSKFLARAVFDEVIAPVFLKNANVQSRLAEQCLVDANGLLNQPFRSERIAHIWGAGDLSSVKRLKGEIDMMFEEFLNTGDVHEADRTVRELNARFFHPQLVKQGIVLALQKEGENRKKILSLIRALSKEDLVSKEHVNQGFALCYEGLEDLKLDLPNAPTHIKELVQSAKELGVLDVDFQEPKKA